MEETPEEVQNNQDTLQQDQQECQQLSAELVSNQLNQLSHQAINQSIV